MCGSTLAPQYLWKVTISKVIALVAGPGYGLAPQVWGMAIVVHMEIFKRHDCYEQIWNIFKRYTPRSEPKAEKLKSRRRGSDDKIQPERRIEVQGLY